MLTHNNHGRISRKLAPPLFSLGLFAFFVIATFVLGMNYFGIDHLVSINCHQGWESRGRISDYLHLHNDQKAKYGLFIGDTKPTKSPNVLSESIQAICNCDFFEKHLKFFCRRQPMQVCKQYSCCQLLGLLSTRGTGIPVFDKSFHYRLICLYSLQIIRFLRTLLIERYFNPTPDHENQSMNDAAFHLTIGAGVAALRIRSCRATTSCDMVVLKAPPLVIHFTAAPGVDHLIPRLPTTRHLRLRTLWIVFQTDIVRLNVVTTVQLPTIPTKFHCQRFKQGTLVHVVGRIPSSQLSRVHHLPRDSTITLQLVRDRGLDIKLLTGLG